MRQAIDSHARAPRPTIEEIVAKVGPMRNKQADASGAGTGDSAGRERRGRRRG